jgi:hypothetical protein
MMDREHDYYGRGSRQPPPAAATPGGGYNAPTPGGYMPAPTPGTAETPGMHAGVLSRGCVRAQVGWHVRRGHSSKHSGAPAHPPRAILARAAAVRVAPCPAPDHGNARTPGGMAATPGGPDAYGQTPGLYAPAPTPGAGDPAGPVAPTPGYGDGGYYSQPTPGYGTGTTPGLTPGMVSGYTPAGATPGVAYTPGLDPAAAGTPYAGGDGYGQQQQQQQYGGGGGAGGGGGQQRQQPDYAGVLLKLPDGRVAVGGITRPDGNTEATLLEGGGPVVLDVVELVEVARKDAVKVVFGRKQGLVGTVISFDGAEAVLEGGDVFEAYLLGKLHNPEAAAA